MGARDARTQGGPIAVAIGATEDAAARTHSAARRHNRCRAEPSCGPLSGAPPYPAHEDSRRSARRGARRRTRCARRRLRGAGRAARHGRPLARRLRTLRRCARVRQHVAARNRHEERPRPERDADPRVVRDPGPLLRPHRLPRSLRRRPHARPRGHRVPEHEPLPRLQHANARHDGRLQPRGDVRLRRAVAGRLDRLPHPVRVGTGSAALRRARVRPAQPAAAPRAHRGSHAEVLGDAGDGADPDDVGRRTLGLHALLEPGRLPVHPRARHGRTDGALHRTPVAGHGSERALEPRPRRARALARRPLAEREAVVPGRHRDVAARGRARRRVPLVVGRNRRRDFSRRDGTRAAPAE
jgi:hypothetical protein